MRWRVTVMAVTVGGVLGAAFLSGDEEYALGPDSMRQPGVPQGTIEGPLIWRSRIFADTIRAYWIYVPAQYDASEPAAVMVFQDGHKYVNVDEEYRVPIVSTT